MGNKKGTPWPWLITSEGAKWSDEGRVGAGKHGSHSLPSQLLQPDHAHFKKAVYKLFVEF